VDGFLEKQIAGSAIASNATADSAPELAKHIVLAQHGILTGRDTVTWPERFEAHAAWSNAGIHVVTDQYSSGPFPRFNTFIKNRRLARAQAAILEHWVHSGPHRSKLSLVGHSNGCDIIRHTARILAKRGIEIENLILISAPINPALSGLRELVCHGAIKRIACWCSPNDTVLAEPGKFWARFIRWPYGNLGRAGATNARAILSGDKPHQAPIYNRWFTGGHSDFFNPRLSTETFDTIITEIKA
tara:strand:- start:45243 stop:45974 length:732 start_codon:yes stop_codon:yes gene_type:complete